MYNIKATWVTLSMGDNSDTTQIVTTSHHTHVSYLKLNELKDFAAGNIQTDSIVDLDEWVWVSDGASLVRGQVWHSLAASTDALDAAQLVASLYWSDTMKNETSLDIVENSEEFICSFNGDDI